MNHARSLRHIAHQAQVVLCAAGLLLATTGCHEATETNENSADGSLGKDVEAFTGFNLYILNVTNAPLTNVQLTFEASVGSTHYLDSEIVTPVLNPPNGPRQCSKMFIGDDPSNELRQIGTGCEPSFPNHSLIKVTDNSVPKFALAKIKIKGLANGECFEDWEVVDWVTPPTLYVNASRGASNGTCRLGNSLQPYN